MILLLEDERHLGVVDVVATEMNMGTQTIKMRSRNIEAAPVFVFGCLPMVFCRFAGSTCCVI